MFKYFKWPVALYGIFQSCNLTLNNIFGNVVPYMQYVQKPMIFSKSFILFHYTVALVLKMMNVDSLIMNLPIIIKQS